MTINVSRRARRPRRAVCNDVHTVYTARRVVAPYGTGKSSDKLLPPPSYLLPFFLLLTEVCLLDGIIIQQIRLPCRILTILTGFEDVAAVRDGQRLLCVLLYQQDGGARFGHFLE